MTEELGKLLEFVDPLTLCLSIFGQNTSKAALPSQQSPTVLRDWELIRSLVPKTYLDQWDSRDLAIQFAMTFTLRHRASQLAIALHRLASPEDPALPPVDRELDIILSWLQKEKRLLSPVPSLGINALGIIIEYPTKGTCRVVDGYKSHLCQNPTSTTLCEAHKNENWWNHGLCQINSSKLFDFYHRWENIHTYDEEQLQSMVKEFWQKYKQCQPVQEEKYISQALELFQLKSLEELEGLDPQVLRRKFLQLSLKMHPDQGGSIMTLWS